MEALGAEHPFMAVVSRNQARAWIVKGECKRALVCCEESEAVLTGAPSKSPQRMANVLSTKGEALLGLGRRSEAVECYTRCLDIRSELLEATHPDCAEGWQGLGRTLAPGLGLEHLRRALDIRVERLGPAHPLTCETHMYLAEALEAVGEAEAARAHLAQSAVAELAVHLRPQVEALQARLSACV